MDGVEEALIGKGKEAIPSALSSVEYSGKPISDVRASSGYREYLSKIYLRRALEEAYARAKGVRS
ncbi:hypothetical protein HS1genome_0544 [Sulfodiicoccus acidiphilus]|uniref:CO dehydrogenase flavoprotein C-terminal domain-containing protein n=1 Tax=Sulfodiicoccus acidiphilus TaxID=1670455 RepID=A0A348B1V3_9CREN|nr:hypothetical protein HS1genome_0544 [Sulfodiicoccus acidiphilus]